MNLLYQITVTLSTPIFALAAAMRRRRRPALARLTAPAPRATRPIWVHACSVGEVNVAHPLIAALRARWPSREVVLSVSTPAGHAHAEKLCPGVALLWFPVDQAFVVRRFFRRVRPRALILVETELWPNVLAEAGRRGVPVALVNGRLSDKHAARYRRFRALFAPRLRTMALAAMQSERYAARIRHLGVPAGRVRVSGIAKFDAAPVEAPAAEGEGLRRAYGLEAETPLLVFGSTRPGDEALARACFARLRAAYPGLRLVLAPRHLERADEAAAVFGDCVTVRHTELRRGAPRPDWEVLLVDTHGDLGRFYAIATVAVVGGSFFPGVNGHNPIEPAALGIPTVFGPYMKNFEEAADALTQGKGALQVASPDLLAEALAALLVDRDAREALAVQARAVVAANRGAIARTVELLAEYLDLDEAAPGATTPA